MNPFHLILFFILAFAIGYGIYQCTEKVNYPQKQPTIKVQEIITDDE